ncbi:MAG TPA: phosphoribosyltransferase family protein [Saprospiraceae bacterium]|nr:phosphoribosyltransferase family protein [Saprospiraceae bacterium]
MALPPLLSKLSSFGHAVARLSFPGLCAACGQSLPSSSPTCFCIGCRFRMPISDMYRHTENEFTQRLWGRLPLVTGAAYLLFMRSGPVQHMLHQLKYHDKPEVGHRLGLEFGLKLADSPIFRSVQGIVPVPLHPKKERIRGYNQSLVFAQGISDILGIPVLSDALQRSQHTQSQTRKGRLARHTNVGEVFELGNVKELQGKHLLLVDDVLTTGATLEACGSVLLSAPDTRLSSATIAIAVKQ